MNWTTLYGWIIGASVATGAVAATLALYGRHRVLPSFLTGPQVCRLENGGCEVLFRSRPASLLGVPNASLGLVLYLILVFGLVLKWPTELLLIGASLGLGMSIYLATYLLRNHLECRICWTGHIANGVIWAAVLSRFLVERVSHGLPSGGGS